MGGLTVYFSTMGRTSSFKHAKLTGDFMPPKQSKPTNDDHGWTVLLDDMIESSGRPDGEGWKSARDIRLSDKLNPTKSSQGAIQKRMERFVHRNEVERTIGTNEEGVRCIYYRPIRN
tara:strand:+ start:709 stop:1059 length:351 start_codon:yes stop_codon:yes gene_type:complete